MTWDWTIGRILRNLLDDTSNLLQHEQMQSKRSKHTQLCCYLWPSHLWCCYVSGQILPFAAQTSSTVEDGGWGGAEILLTLTSDFQRKNTWHLLIHLERHIFKSILYCKQNWRKFMTQCLVSKQSRLLHSQHNRCFLNLSLRWLRRQGSILPSNSLTVIL